MAEIGQMQLIGHHPYANLIPRTTGQQFSSSTEKVAVATLPLGRRLLPARTLPLIPNLRFFNSQSHTWKLFWLLQQVPYGGSDVRIVGSSPLASAFVALRVRANATQLTLGSAWRLEIFDNSGITVSQSVLVQNSGHLSISGNDAQLLGPGTWQVLGNISFNAGDISIKSVPSFIVDTAAAQNFFQAASIAVQESVFAYKENQPTSSTTASRSAGRLTISNSTMTFDSKVPLTYWNVDTYDSTFDVYNSALYYLEQLEMHRSTLRVRPAGPSSQDYSQLGFKIAQNNGGAVFSESNVKVYGSTEFGELPFIDAIDSDVEFFGTLSMHCPRDSYTPRWTGGSVIFHGVVNSSCGLNLINSNMLAESVRTNNCPAFCGTPLRMLLQTLDFNSDFVDLSGKSFFWRNSTALVRGAATKLKFSRFGSPFELSEGSTFTVEQAEITFRIGNMKKVEFENGNLLVKSGSVLVGPLPNPEEPTSSALRETMFRCAPCNITLESGSLTLDTIDVRIQDAALRIGGSLIFTDVAERLVLATQEAVDGVFSVWTTSIDISGSFVSGRGHRTHLKPIYSVLISSRQFCSQRCTTPTVPSR